MLINARREFDESTVSDVPRMEGIDDRRRVRTSADVVPSTDANREPEQLTVSRRAIPEGTPPEKLTNLLHQDAKKRFSFSHARDWHVVSPDDDNSQLVMRLVERGEFLAQATITPWKKTDPTKSMSLNEFAELMKKTPSWALEKETERKTLDQGAKGHHTVHRVIASGELDGVRTAQYFT